MEGASQPSSTSGNSEGLLKFPAFSPDAVPYDDGAHRRSTSSPQREGDVRQYNPDASRSSSDNRFSDDRFHSAAAVWQARRSSRANGGYMGGRGGPGGRGHGRQRSLSEAIQVIRERKGSMSQNAAEIADALKAPVSPKLVALCIAWYLVSTLANTSAGQILRTFPKPVTLTIIQFAFVTAWCITLSNLAKAFPVLKEHIPALRNGIRKPTRELINTTLPLTGFMIGGHILTSDAMSRIPVSLVHTIKGLSPLFTVAAYRIVFKYNYHYTTYLSLLPLTIGVIMACSTQFSNNFLGLISAFASAILFVTQNIMSKKLFDQAAQAESDMAPLRARKPDKLNLLCYSSALAFAFTAPIWLWSEGFGIIGDFLHDASIDLNSKQGSLDHGRLLIEYVFNGTFHFAQSLVAFTLLSMVSPVTYSVASLIKRVFVICFAIIWFGNSVSGIQGFGIALTFLGLYLYDRTSDHAKAEKRAKNTVTRPLLPVTETSYEGAPVFSESPAQGYSAGGFPHVGGYSGGAEEEKRREEEAIMAGGNSKPDPNGWLAPGTKAEDTWRGGDGRPGVSVQ